MHFFGALVACICLFLLFPKGFKYLVGTWVGVTSGIVFWAMFAIMFPCLITGGAIATFVVVGIAMGCVLAAKG